MENDEISKRFVNFLREKYYQNLLEAVRDGSPSLEIDFKALDEFDTPLSEKLLYQPEDTLKIFGQAVKEIDLPDSVEMKFRFRNLPEFACVPIRHLRSHHIGQFVSVEGTVRRSSEILPEISETIWVCPQCGSRIVLEQNERTMKKPIGCDCGYKGRFELFSKKLVDTRLIQIEEPFESTEGEKPSQLNIYLRDDLTSQKMRTKTDAGNRLRITGIMKEVPKATQKGKRSVQLDILLAANHIETTEIEASELKITPEDEQKIIEFSKDPNIYEKIIDSIATSTYGLREIKEAIAYQLFSGVPHIMKDGTRIRGDIHILLIGEPSTGKSQLLKLVSKLANRGKYVSGKGVTSVGLCTTYDTLIFLDNGRVMKIGDLVESELRGKKIEGEIISCDGSVERNTLGFDQNGIKIKPMRITKYWKIKASKELIEIETRSGKKVKVTLDNPIPVLAKGKIEWLRASEIKSTDTIPTLMIGENATKSTIDTDQSSAYLQLIKNEIFWDSVKSVRVVENKEEWVYDLTVEKEHSFVANGIVIHNTAAVIKDEQFSGGWVLEAGAMVLANKGVCNIDEFEKMNESDQVSLHEALEQQSYHPSTEIMLADGTKHKIGDLVERLLEKNKHKIVQGINCEILPTDEIEVLTTDFKDIYPIKVNRVSRHTAPKNFYKITFSNGRNILVTPEHPLFVIDGTKVSTIPAEKAEIGLSAPAPSNLPITTKNTELQSVERLHPNEKQIQVPRNITPELASVLGYYASEGHSFTGARSYEVGFSNSNQYIVDDMIPSMKSSFSITPYVQINKGVSIVRYSSGQLMRFLKNNFPVILQKARKKYLPDILLSSPEDARLSFLRSAFLGDGFVDSERFGYCTTSLNLAKGYQEMLLSAGIYSYITHDESSDSYKVVISSTECMKKFLNKIVDTNDQRKSKIEFFVNRSAGNNRKHELPASVAVAIKNALAEFKLDDGYFCQSQKEGCGVTKNRVEKYLNILRRRVSEMETALKYVEDSAKLRKICGVSQDVVGREFGINHATVSYIERKKQHKRKQEVLNYVKTLALRKLDSTNNLIKDLEALCNPNLKWLTITGVETVPNKGVEWVYDVTVEPTRSFISECLILHNTISISKASIMATLPAQTSVLAAANPKFGRFDFMKGIAEQITVPETLLSVDYEEPILIKENGVAKIKKIGEFVDKYYTKDTNQPVFVNEKLEAAAFNKDYKVEWWPIKYVFRHTVNSPLYKVKLDSGREVKLSKGHCIFVFEDGQIKQKPSDKLSVGDHVVIPKSLPSNDLKISELNLARELLKLDDAKIKNIFLHNVPEDVIIRLKITDQNWKQGKKLPLIYAEKMTDEELKKCALKYKGGHKNGAPVFVQISKGLMRLLGYYIAEGSLFISGSSEHLISIVFNKKELNLIEDLKRISKKIFNHDASVVKDGNAIKVNIAHKIAYLLLKDILNVTIGAENKRVPEIVFNVDQKLQKEFIRAYHDGDYCVSISKGLISDLLYLLLQNNVIASMHKTAPHKVTFPDGHSTISKTSYSIVDADKKIKNFKSNKWYSQIPLEPIKDVIISLSRTGSKANFNGIKKSAKLITRRLWKEFLKKFMKIRIERLIALKNAFTVEEFAQKIYGKKFDGSRVQKEWTRQYLNRWVERGLLKKEKVNGLHKYQISEKGSDILEKVESIKTIMNGDLGFAKIRNIEMCGSTSRFVYDVSTPGHENFIAGTGGVACHNSRFDLKFALFDVPDLEKDTKLADHILKSRTSESYAEGDPVIDPVLLRKYVAYARKNCFPKLTAEVGEIIKNFYIETRSKYIQRGPISITPRQYEALMRLAESSAKIRLSPVVTEEDARRAIKLLQTSLQQLGMDKDTGLIDIDKIESGTSSSQRNKIRIILDVVDALTREIGKVIPIEDVISAAENEGINESDSMEVIERLKREGQLMEPKYKHVQKV